jgi:hypothetical protein
MSELVSELKQIFQDLIANTEGLSRSDITHSLDTLEKSAKEVGKAWSHSWLGYQSNVYHEGLTPPPPGAHFSSEWGFTELYTMGTTGDWKQFPDGAVERAIRTRAGNPDINKCKNAFDESRKFFERQRDEVISILRAATGQHKNDPYIDKLVEEVEKITTLTAADFVTVMRPKGDLISRDSVAIMQGLWTPPHIAILADVYSMKSAKSAMESLSASVRRAFSHLDRIEKKSAAPERIGTNVAIGHGHSKEWKDLKDFIHDRMRLPWDEFNRVSVAGVPNTVRLSAMLDAAAIAFLVLTAEDETADGKVQARMNVVHEAGLFQGRLGFNKAIILLEDGCEEFSNIQGLGQIRFPKSNIKAAFHDVQLLLEREGLIE